MRLEAIAEVPVQDALLSLLDRLKHDLGKYVALQARWLPPEAGPVERREALVADLLHTRRGPEGSTSAHEVWETFRGMLHGEVLLDGHRVALGDDPDVVVIEDRMRSLGALRSVSAVEALVPEAVDEALSACAEVGARCRSLVRRARDHRRRSSPPDEER